jgi:TolB-like protein/tetratricopeptide (TPR) repeat protein
VSGMRVRGLLGAAGDFAVELRRRHVIRVALVYAAVSWMVAEVSSTFFPALGIPSWALSLVMMMLLLGFPLAVALAWAFDLTPDGLRRSGAPDRSEPNRGADMPATLPTAVAALPFVDRSAAADQQYLGDGITEELINGLARVEGLRVVSRTSAFSFRGSGSDVRSIGVQLGVSHVIEGSVRLADDRLRLAVQLVSVHDGYAVWSGTFDRRLDDVFAVQEEVARSVLAALRPALADACELPDDDSAPVAEADRLVQRSTSDFEAYSLYLRGRQQWNERTPAALRRALEFFDRAVARDPDFAHAHAGIADCWAILVDHGIVAPRYGLMRARQAADTAMRLGTDLAESHAAAALVAQLDWRLDAAERGFREALLRQPSYAPARQRLALMLAWRGRFGEAREEIARARRYDPLSPAASASAAWIEYYAGDVETAARLATEAIEAQPDVAPPRLPRALALLALNRPEDAIRDLDAALCLAPESVWTRALLIAAVARAGRRDDARAMLAEALAAAEARRADGTDTGATCSFAFAVAQLGIGEVDAAFVALEQAVEQRAPQLVAVACDPFFAELRGEPRWRKLIEGVAETGRALATAAS